MNKPVEKMIVNHINNLGNRVILYNKIGDDYHVIMNNNNPLIKPGDTIEYEPYGVNFGFFIRKVKG